MTFFLLRSYVCTCPCDQSNGAVVDVLAIKSPSQWKICLFLVEDSLLKFLMEACATASLFIYFSLLRDVFQIGAPRMLSQTADRSSWKICFIKNIVEDFWWRIRLRILRYRHSFGYYFVLLTNWVVPTWFSKTISYRSRHEGTSFRVSTRSYLKISALILRQIN